VPGRPALYGTTRRFLDQFNLKSLADLPSLAKLRDLDAVSRDLFGPEGPEGVDLPGVDAAGEAS
jgi:segregation and condensation protein B